MVDDWTLLGESLFPMSDSNFAGPDADPPPVDGAARPETRLPKSLRILALTTPFVLFLGILAGIEGIVRATLPHVSALSLFVSSPLQQDGFTDSENVTIFEGDPVRFWRPTNRACVTRTRSAPSARGPGGSSRSAIP
jgi:hypothetical protein